MQQTLLNILTTNLTNNLNNFFSNPWRKLSLILITLLMGFFAGSTVSASMGQTSLWDPSIALAYLIFTEVLSIIIYRRKSNQKTNSFWMNVLNAFKIGFIYMVYLESIKLNY